MRFMTDENLPIEVAEFLAQSEFDALRVDEQGLAGVADPGIASGRRGRVLWLGCGGRRRDISS
jgi:predicted nuclease of predicted toxin-antitoxin system